MDYREIIGPDELDWKVVPLDWKKIGKEELKMGTPMSKDGVEANDSSCYGILMDDVQKDKHFQARVIVSGCVDFAKAEEYSGVKISAEAKKAIGKVWSQGGGGLTELPEGYPYKEGVTIEWDGNTDGHGTTGTVFVKVSDVTLTKEQLIGATVKIECPQMSEMNASFVIVASDISEENGVLYVAPEMAGSVIIRCAENAVYFASIEIGPGYFLHTSFLAAETIQPMAEEFMPLLTSPNGTKYKLTVSDDGTLSAVKA